MALKVFDLQCEAHHIFEGWFSSHEDYDSQQERGLLTCPLCGNGKISKMLSAPRLNVSHLKKEKQPAPLKQAPKMEATANLNDKELAKIQAAVMQQLRVYVKQTEDVGKQFTAEARRIHYGEAKERPIRGNATPEQRQALQEEGIEVMPIPDFLDENQLQ
ncbi:DUF1178 family protein [Advenella sp. WQ 585]|uniref:DUF1178 family protein n=1 Tax=Advenella mandrilli TaxID=2800330 RepID=A0ABS1EA42_9BURK|nr:DUF1178 family protein [Advenella mandrilli]MBK1779743.1 DUF1178 family protein [Advenella mandrilli]